MLKNKLKSGVKKRIKVDKQIRFKLNVFLIFFIFAGVFISLYYFGEEITGFVVFETNSLDNFNQGIYFNTSYNISGFVQLNDTFTSGTYMSKIFDAESNASWNNIFWTSDVIGELPNDQQIETKFVSGNANMTGNVLLMHMDEVNGIIVDTSGEKNNGTTYGGVTYGVDGKLNTALSFDGIDDYVEVNDSASLDVSNAVTVEAWMKASSDGWKYKKPIFFSRVILEPDYQIKIKLNVSNFNYSKAKVNGDDLRFYQTDGVKLNYWIEKWNTSGNSIVWVKINSSGINKIYMYYGNPSVSSESDKIGMFSYSSPQPIYYVVNERSGGQVHNLISFADNNVIECGGSIFTLNKGENVTCTPAWGEAINSTKPFYADVAVDAIAPPIPVSFAGKIFSYMSFRGINRFSIYALDGDAHVEIYDNGIFKNSVDISKGTVTTIAQDITDGDTVRIESNVSILISHYTTGSDDGYDFYPATKEWYGTPSNYLEIGTGVNGANVMVYYSNGTSLSYVLGANSQVGVGNLGSQGTAPGAYVIADQPIGVNQLADGDGSEASTFLPKKEFDTEFYVPLSGQYVALVSDELFRCNINGGNYFVASGGPKPYPYKLLFGSVNVGTYINCSAPVQAYYEQSANDQETNLWGIKQFRKHISSEPTINFGNETIVGILKSGAYGVGMNTTTAFTLINNQTISAPIISGWNHIVLTYNGLNQKLYVNGKLKNSQTLTGVISINSNNLLIGDLFNGTIDEVAIWNRSLSAQEVENIYKRGVLKLNLSVRSCDDINCGGDVWIDVNETSLQNISMVDNRYFQYKFFFETDNLNYTPKLYNVSINYSYVHLLNITVISPVDYGVYTNDWMEINVSINNPGNCSYALDNSSYLGMDFINNTYFFKNLTNLDEGLYNITINCTDFSGNNNLSLKHFTISFNPGCSNGLKDQDESDIDCGGICGNNCNDGNMCNSEIDCLSGFCENNVCVSCSDGIKNNNETDIDCGGPHCGACTIGKNCSTISDCSSEATSCSNDVCSSCSDGILNQGEDLVDCGGSYCSVCEYFPYIYDDCGNSVNETHLIQGINFTFVGGINSSLSDAEKSVNYHNDKVIYRYPVDKMYDYQAKIKLLQPTNGGRIENIFADSNVLDSLRVVPEYNSLQYTYKIPISSYANDSMFDLIFEKVSGANAVCSEIEIWKSTSFSSSLSKLSYLFDFNNSMDYIYNDSEILINDSSAKIHRFVETNVWDSQNKANFDEGFYNKTLYNETNSVLELNLNYNNGTYYSKIFDSDDVSIWHNISWVQLFPYGQELPDNKKIETKWLSGNMNMTENALLLHMNEENGTIVDTSGEGNNGTYNGVLYSQPGKLNTAIGFNGISDLISVSENTPLNFTNNFSYGAWFKADSIPTYSGIMSRESSWGNGYNLNLRSNGIFCGWGKYTGNFGAPSVDKWYHAVCVYENRTMKLYVNGVLKGQDTGVMGVGNQNLKIGSFYSGGALKFNGTIDDVFVFNKTLSQQEIFDIYKRGALKLNLSVRSCDDVNCNNYVWVDVNGTSPRNLSVANNRYFQYKINLESYNKDYSPQLNKLSVVYLKNKSVDVATIETKDLVVNNLLKWLNVSINDSNRNVISNESNESYDYASVLTGATAMAQGGAEHLIDEDETINGGDYYGYCYWPCNMTITFNRSAYINKIYTHLWDGDSRYYNYSLWVSGDGVNWIKVVNDKYAQGPQNDTFNATLTKYLKIEGLHNTANTGFHVIEVDAFEAKQEKEIKYFYSVDSGMNWNMLPLNGDISNLSTSKNKIRFKANITNEGVLYDMNVSYYGFFIVNCSDNIKNQDETDIDCGGNFCSKCLNGKYCLSNSDCQSNLCSSGICQSSETGNNGIGGGFGSGSGGGSGGSSGGIVISNKVNEKINDQKIEHDKNFTIKNIYNIFSDKITKVLFDKTINSVDSIDISTNKNVSGVLFKVKKITEIPKILPKLNNTYEYLKITVENLSDDIIKEAVIKFNVNKSWIDVNDFDSVFLYRYQYNSWIKLKTEKVNENNLSIFYKAQTPGFSYFAIVGQKKSKSQEELISELPSLINKQVKDYLKLMIFIGVFVLIVIFILKKYSENIKKK